MIPQYVKEIINKLNDHGYEAFIVGGAVRDYILNRPINDWDITTDALPDDIESLFPNTVAVGKQFGTIKVLINNESVEITTYRLDSDTSDGRRPTEVQFTTSIKEDLSRRDFTMNAMIMTASGAISDYFGGQDHLNSKMLWTVGQAKKRFEEDYLRVYRYVRLTAELNFHPNRLIDDTILNMSVNETISFERIQIEFNKILLSNRPSSGIRHLKKLNLLNYICPGIEKTYHFNQHSLFHDKDVFEHTMAVLDASSCELTIRLAALFHDIGKPDTFELISEEGHFYGHDKKSVQLTETILHRLKYSNEIKDNVLRLIKYHMRLLDKDNTKSIKKFIRRIGEENIDAFFDLRRADIIGSKTNDTLEALEDLKNLVRHIINTEPPLTVNDLKISGYDLMELGFSGKIIGEIKKYLLDLVDADPQLNDFNKLKNIVANKYL